ncbi:MAG: hypothetical protein F8N37_15255 [Telmatospirillum sp.]|nr:hypothetical protein [Telmatospirillum sp.]
MSLTPTGAAAPRNLRQWLTEVALPSFARIAVRPDEEGYVEFLTPDFSVDPRPRKSTLSTGRLIYCFSHAAVLDPKGPGLAAARHGMDYLTRRCANPEGGFYKSLNADGSPLNPNADLGDLAFVLFALGWYHRASGEDRALALAEQTYAFMERTMASPAGGFAEDLAGTLPRRQNPHMHLLEACHVLAEQSKGAAAKAWTARASSLVDLLAARFIDPANSSLYELFDADWTPFADAPREPGSHFEWVWALLHHRRLTGDDRVLPIAEGLYRFALTFGLDHDPACPTLAFDAVDGAGAPLVQTKLMWPQTEAIKAFAARAEFLGDEDALVRLQAMTDLLFRHYVDVESGLFTNQIERDGRKRAVEMPIRVLYHLELALAEAARLHA